MLFVVLFVGCVFVCVVWFVGGGWVYRVSVGGGWEACLWWVSVGVRAGCGGGGVVG